MVLGLGPLDLTTTGIFFIFQKINGQTKKIEISHQQPYQMAVDSCRRLIRQLAVEFSALVGGLFNRSLNPTPFKTAVVSIVVSAGFSPKFFSICK
jgi:hypothetical protein